MLVLKGLADDLEALRVLIHAFLNHGLFARCFAIFYTKHDVLCNINRHGWLAIV